MKIKRKTYIENVKKDFLALLIKNWQKRNNRLLHLGLGHGIEPSFFWDLGFDVSVLCQSQEELVQCQKTNGKKIEYFIGKHDHLPFDEKVFDYVVLTHVLGSSPENSNNYADKKSKEEHFSSLIEEAQRVSAKSICLLEFSSFALSKLEPHISPFLLRKITKTDKYNLSELTKNNEEILACFSSALHSPSFMWHERLLPFSSYPLNIPFGSLIATTLNHSPLLMTSLPLQVSSTVSEII